MCNVSCFLLINVSIFPITWLDSFWRDLYITFSVMFALVWLGLISQILFFFTHHRSINKEIWHNLNVIIKGAKLQQIHAAINVVPNLFILLRFCLKESLFCARISWGIHKPGVDLPVSALSSCVYGQHSGCLESLLSVKHCSKWLERRHSKKNWGKPDIFP